MLPFEFVVSGTPVSHQTNNRKLLRDWIATVRAAAERVWPTGQSPTEENCLFLAVYFYERPGATLDNDNMVKPIQDALIGLVYRDDRQVTDSLIRRTSIQGPFFIQDQSDILLAAIRWGNDFVYVRVEDAPDHRSLL